MKITVSAQPMVCCTCGVERTVKNNEEKCSERKDRPYKKHIWITKKLRCGKKETYAA